MLVRHLLQHISTLINEMNVQFKTVICFFDSPGVKEADLANPSWKSRVDYSSREPPRHSPTLPTFTLLCVGDLDPTLATKRF